ncbi:MAG: DNA starvation/stationary phase protection protein [Acidobacteria bacterium]|nr:DNA starvation/stationary phase protection protein [Acidobacteriota bacterium]
MDDLLHLTDMSTISIGLDQSQRIGVANLLRQTLADEYVLYTKTRKYHWNVEGPHFHDLHKLFESQYEEIDETIDEVAERIRALGLYSTGSFEEFLKDARIKEDAGGQVGANQMIENLLSDHEAIIRSLRADLVTAAESYGDAGNQDFLTGLLESHEKAAWMLRSLLR